MTNLWVLPGSRRRVGQFRGREITIDLFASEVACELSTADHLLGNRLGEESRATVRKEVKRRIFDPYVGDGDEGQTQSGVVTIHEQLECRVSGERHGHSVGLLDQPEQKAFYVAAAEKYIDSFLRGFTEDGYCSEGIGYWNYGYGCFVRLAHMLNGATGGKVDLLRSSEGAVPACSLAGSKSLPACILLSPIVR